MVGGDGVDLLVCRGDGQVFDGADGELEVLAVIVALVLGGVFAYVGVIRASGGAVQEERAEVVPFVVVEDPWELVADEFAHGAGEDDV